MAAPWEDVDAEEDDEDAEEVSRVLARAAAFKNACDTALLFGA